MKWRINTLGKKIALGYVLISMILAIAVIITITKVFSLTAVADRLTHLRAPASITGLELINQVDRSVSTLRVWLAEPDPDLRDQRMLIWEEIRLSYGHLKNLALLSPDQVNVDQLNAIEPLLFELKAVQQQVEDLAINDKQGAVLLLKESVAPLGLRLQSILKEMKTNQEFLMKADFQDINTQIVKLTNLEWILLAIGLVASSLLTLIITRTLTRPINQSIEVARNIGEGNLGTKVEIEGSKELEILGQALTNMKDSLKKKEEENQRHNWLVIGQNRLNEVMRGDKPLQELSDDILTFLSEYTGSNVGAIYLSDERKEELVLTGRFAFSNGQAAETFRFGEGLIGQAAKKQEMIHLYAPDKKDLTVKSSFVEVPLKNLLVVPFLYDKKTLGVLELGAVHGFSEESKQLIASSMDSIGVTINSSLARKKIQELLEKTQVQTEELQQQQEELEQNNEEMEEQNQKLKEQWEELQATNEELEEQAQEIEEKNKKLEEARIDIELKAMNLESSNRYKSEFLANMSHELRTPLNSLLILAGDLARNGEGNLSKDQIESAEVISKCGHDLLTLINEILDLAKIESGKIDVNFSQVNLRDLANDIHRQFKKTAGAKGIMLSVSLDETLPETILTDKQRLDQIMKNLISNALKFTEKGQIQVDFFINAGSYFSASVKDSGIGIPKAKQATIFEAFQQADGSIARKYGGTGLGLSISRELASLLRGKITVESEEGRGSTFTLSIPMDERQPHATPILPLDHAITKSTPEKQEFNYPSIEDQRSKITAQDYSVLIIEDDPDFARILAKQSAKKGFKFLAASTGEEGLKLAANYHPNAIILDLELPVMKGEMVLKTLKSTPDLRHIPVHIISSNHKTVDPIRSGAVEYLTKPVTREQIDEVFGRIESFISRKMKNLLVVEDDKTLRKSIVKLIGNGDVVCLEAGTAEETLKFFETHTIDCMVIDIGLPDMDGFELISEIEKKMEGALPPIIVYTGRSLSKKETETLNEYAETIIVKGVKSEERLLDETALFLHRTISRLPPQKQNIIFNIYTNERVFHGKKILLVDDDMRNVFALSKILKDQHLDVIKAENGRAALDVLKTNPDVDVILMDVMMPVMDGYECMKKIRKTRIFKDLPIIALTAKSMKEDRKKCIDAGANDYISKPVDVERLMSLMRIWIKNRRK